MIESQTFDTDQVNYYDPKTRFEFGPDAYYDLRIDMDHALPNNASILFAFCTLSKVIRFPSEPVLKCEHIKNSCIWSAYVGAETLHARMTSDITNSTTEPYDVIHFDSVLSYAVFAFQCDHSSDSQFSGTMSWTARQADGSYLSYDQRPFKPLYTVALFVWSGLVLIWVGNWWRYRGWNVRLQRALTCVPLVCALTSAAWLHTWTVEASTGIASDLRILSYLLDSLFR